MKFNPTILDLEKEPWLELIIDSGVEDKLC
jgi:hypothetical protein